MVTKAKLEIFSDAFRSGYGSCRMTCECGKTFWHDDRIYTWEPGEVESLQQDSNAVRLNWCPSAIGFEGREFVMDCDCWHERAQKLMLFIDTHAFKIAAYLNAEKKRKQSEANDAPEVD